MHEEGAASAKAQGEGAIGVTSAVELAERLVRPVVADGEVGATDSEGAPLAAALAGMQADEDELLVVHAKVQAQAVTPPSAAATLTAATAEV